MENCFVKKEDEVLLVPINKKSYSYYEAQTEETH